MGHPKLVVLALLALAVSGTAPAPMVEVIATDQGPAYLGLRYTGEPVARVTGIAPGYPAWRAGIRCGDLVLFAESLGTRFPLAYKDRYADPGIPLKLVVARQVAGVWHIEEHFLTPSTQPAREPEMRGCEETGKG